jgi:hypothetical protein
MIVVEMNITIIAASVVVMRSYFQGIFDFIFPKSPYASHNASKYNGSNGIEMEGRGQRMTGVFRLASQTESSQDILQGDL